MGCAACAAAAAITASAAPPASAAARKLLVTDTTKSRRRVQPDAVFRVRTNKRIVALTFDDGPDPQYTPRVLDILDSHKAKATFFVVGVNALAHEDLIADQRSAGHSFGNHTYDHRDLDRLALAGVRDEIDRGASALQQAGVGPTSLFRPPKGYTTPDVRVATAHDRYRTIFWDACVEHYVDHTAVARGVDRMLHHAAPGSVLLAHDGGTIAGTGQPSLDRSRTIDALPRLLAGLERKRLTVVDVPTLLAESPA